jgi:hypothetical protein
MATLVEEINRLLPQVNNKEIKILLQNELSKYKVLETPTTYNFYGNIIPIPSDIVNDVDKKLNHIRMLMKDHPYLFTSKHKCSKCGKEYNITKFGILKVNKGVYVRSYCHSCMAKCVSNYIKNKNH